GRLSGPRYDHKLRQPRQFFRCSPLRQLQQMIRTYQVKEPRLWEAAGVIANGVYGVGNAATTDFLLVNLAPGLARQGQPQQPQPLLRGGWPGVRLKRRLRRRNEEKLRQVQFLPRRLCHQQVSQVDWV